MSLLFGESRAARIEEIIVLRNGKALRTVHPRKSRARFNFEDHTLEGEACYYVRVTQADQDQHGNQSRAWSSPIWARRRLGT